jgi:hypothetical protein
MPPDPARTSLQIGQVADPLGQVADPRRPSNNGHGRKGLKQAVALLNQCTHTLERLPQNGGSHAQ